MSQEPYFTKRFYATCKWLRLQPTRLLARLLAIWCYNWVHCKIILFMCRTYDDKMCYTTQETAFFVGKKKKSNFQTQHHRWSRTVHASGRRKTIIIVMHFWRVTFKLRFRHERMCIFKLRRHDERSSVHARNVWHNNRAPRTRINNNNNNNRLRNLNLDFFVKKKSEPAEYLEQYPVLPIYRKKLYVVNYYSVFYLIFFSHSFWRIIPNQKS